MLEAFHLLFLLDIRRMLEHLSATGASSNGDHSWEESIQEQIDAPINTHQSSADQIFIQEERGG